MQPTQDVFRARPALHVRTWTALQRSLWPSVVFLAQTEVHVYAIAVAANVLLTFFPFLVAMVLLCRSVLHWNAAVQMIFQVLKDYFPPGFGVDFPGALLAVANKRQFSWPSVFLLLFTANGIFVPLEVAFNRIWRATVNRSFLRNQVVSLGLIFACGCLVLASVCISTLNTQYLKQHFGSSPLQAVLQLLAFRVTAVLMGVLLIFLIYWILPNCRMRVSRLIPASVVVGLLLELSKYINVLTWPYLRDKLRGEVPPFVQSISILLWSFLATLIVLAGAEWSARVTVDSLDAASSVAAEAPEPALTADGNLSL